MDRPFRIDAERIERGDGLFELAPVTEAALDEGGAVELFGDQGMARERLGDLVVLEHAQDERGDPWLCAR